MSAVKKFNEMLSESLNLVNDKSLKLCSGSKDGYTFAITPSDDAGTKFYLTFCVKTLDGPVSQTVLEEIKSKSNTIFQIKNTGNYGVAMTIKTESKVRDYINDFKNTIDEVITYFKFHNIVNVDEVTGEPCNTFIINNRGKVQIVGDKTYSDLKREMGIRESNPVKGNMFMGILGALIGSLIGVLVIIIIGQLGFVAAISGVAMGFATLEGYKLLGKKLDLKGIIISIVIMIIMTYVGARLDYAISIKRQVPEAELYFVFKSIPMFIKEGILDGEAYYGNIALTYLFSVMGAISSIRTVITENKNENVFRKIGE